MIQDKKDKNQKKELLKSMIVSSSEHEIHLKFNPSWELISPLWELVNDFLGEIITERKNAEIIAMAINELLENAVKYHDNKVTKEKRGVIFNLHIDKSKKEITCFVSNPANKNNSKELQKEIENIQNQGDLREAYIENLKRAGERTDGKSQLGLIRILYEARGMMDINHNDGMIKVTTKFNY